MSNVTPMPTGSRPAPLVPKDCTTSGCQWLALHGDRLRKSKWWRRASDMARARNVMLWWAAFKSVPAGSLPDDDDELAEAAGFGLDTDAFIAAKAEIMAPWVLCSDGRWYHPTVCAEALETWERISDRRKAGAARQAAFRARVKGNAETPKGDAETAKGNASTGDQPEGRNAQADENNALLPRTRQDKTRQDRVLTDSSSAEADDGPDDDLLGGFPPTPAPKPEPIKPAFDAYNALAAELGLPIAKALNETRRKALKARLREHGLDGWKQALNEIRKSDFLQGKTDRWGGADLDFVLQAKSFQRLIEGYYSRGGGGKPPGGGGRQSWV